jgi:PAS domain S-box-containing protein
MKEKLRESETGRKQLEEESAQSKQFFRLKLENDLSSSQKMDSLELSDIIDVQSIQPLMDDFYKLTHIPIGINDLKGNVLVTVGWQEICARFHRIHPETFRYCVESDTKLSSGVIPGEFKLYRCKNNMWDIVTPIMVSNQHIGYVFGGQFFFEDDHLDYEFFRAQAKKYGFNEEEYIAALEKVPRLSREAVETGLGFFRTFANMLSQLSYSNIKLAQSLKERNELVEALQESEKRERARSDELKAVLDAVPVAVFIARDPQVLQITGNRLACEWLHVPVGTNFSKSAPEGERPEMFNLFKSGMEIPPADMPSQMAAEGIEVNNCELDIVSADGEMRHVLGNAKPLRDEKGNLRGSISAFIDITERKKAEEVLRSLNIYNRSLIEASLDPLVTIGPDGKITDVNGATEKVTGYSRNELIGTDFSDYFTEPEKARAGYQQVFMDGEIRDYPLEIQHKDGQITHILYNASVYRDEDGKVIGIFAAARDITAIKKAEEKIQTLANAVESSDDAILTKSLEGIITSWNKGAEKVYGYLAEEVLGKNISVLEPDNTKGETKHLIEKIEQGERVQHYETLRMKKDGTIINISVTFSPVFDSSGKLVAISTIARDITERKKAEKALKKVHQNLEEKIKERTTELEKAYNSLKESEMGLAEAQKIAHIGNWDWDLVTNEVHWSDELYYIFGRSPQESGATYDGLLTYIHPDDRDHVGNAIKNAFYEKPSGIDYRIVLDSGEERIVHAQSEVFFDEKNIPIRAKGTVQDITERKKVEEALKNLEIIRKKEIHHRIKNNLQVISSLLDLQAEKFNKRECIKDSEVLEAFRESQDRVTSIALIHEELHEEEGTNDTLNFSLYLHRLVENLFQTYRFGNTNINLNLDLEENVFFDMDTAVPLGMIVNELVSNSFKYAFPNREHGKIEIKLFGNKLSDERKEPAGKDSRYTLIASDNGVGIPEKVHVKDSNTLGLQLVNLLVDQLDGTLELKRDKGTEFVIKFSAMQ